MTVNQVQADNRRMKRFICERIPPDDLTRIVLADGPEGPAWADLWPVWDDDGDCDLLIETNEPEWVGLREVFDHLYPSEKKASVHEDVIHPLPNERGQFEAFIETLNYVECKVLATLTELGERISQIEANLGVLVQQKTIKDWYTIKDIATLLGKKEYTVREWCRLGRVNCKKLRGGRGNEGEWRISHVELLRLQTEGLLPISVKY